MAAPNAWQHRPPNFMQQQLCQPVVPLPLPHPTAREGERPSQGQAADTQGLRPRAQKRRGWVMPPSPRERALFRGLVLCAQQGLALSSCLGPARSGWVLGFTRERFHSGVQVTARSVQKA